MRRPLFLLLAALAAASCAKPSAGVRDDLGREVAIPRRVHRIVSLAPNLTEILFAAGAGAEVVATDDFSDTPDAAKRLPRVGGVQPSVERIVAARPDVVFALSSSNYPLLAAGLRGAGVPLYVVRTDRLDDIARAVARIGELAGVGREAEAAATRLRQDVERQRRRRADPPRVAFVIWTEPLYAAGRETFADDLFALTGAKNALEVQGWPQYSLEALVAAAPDLILYPNRSVTAAQIEQLLRAAPQLRRAQVAPVDENRFTRPGPRVAEAAMELNAILDRREKAR